MRRVESDGAVDWVRWTVIMRGEWSIGGLAKFCGRLLCKEPDCTVLQGWLSTFYTVSCGVGFSYSTVEVGG